MRGYNMILLQNNIHFFIFYYFWRISFSGHNIIFLTRSTLYSSVTGFVVWKSCPMQLTLQLLSDSLGTLYCRAQFSCFLGSFLFIKKYPYYKLLLGNYTKNKCMFPYFSFSLFSSCVFIYNYTINIFLFFFIYNLVTEN